MFSFNAGHKLPTLRQAQKWWGERDSQGKVIIQFLSSLEKYTPLLEDTSAPLSRHLQSSVEGDFDDDQCPYDRFMDPGNDRLLDIDLLLLPDLQPELPPHVAKRFCLKDAFRSDYADVEWIHALTALDYLRGYESTRRAKLRRAAKNLGITMENWRDVLSDDPDAKNWVEQVQEQELRIESFYANIFIDLRIWTMIHTLKSEHFYKSDVLAMLNTLFPPGVRELPNDRINPKVLHKHRSTFYRYIMAVEANGPKIMDSFEERLLRPGTRHGWQETRQNLEAYLDLADRMMDQTEEAFGIAFFRKSQSSRTDSWTPSSSSERPMTGSSRNTSFDDQTPMESPRVAGPLHDKSSIKSRIRNLPKISTANGTQNYVDRTQASVPSTASLDSSPNSWSNMPQNPRPKTPLVDPNPTQVRPHALSRPTTPFFEPNSEATRSETFWRPVNPLADPRAILQTHRRTISSINRPATSLDFRGPFNGTLDMTIRQSDSPSIPLISPNTALPSDNLEFLQRPYESSTHPVLKKKTSFGNLFLRRKASAASSAFQDNFDEIDALGIKPTSAKPMETFPRFSTDEQLGERPKLKKQFSLGFLEDEMRPWSRASRRSDAEPSPKPKTKAKMTFVSMFTKNSTQGELEPDFIETADKHFTLANHSSILQKARSYGSSISPTDSERTLTPGSTSGRTTPRKTALKPPLKSPRKTPRLFRKRSTEVIITSADIKEPFPLALQKQVLTPRIDKDPNKARAEQYSRDWFLADAHAKNFDWNKPAGGPVKEPTKKEKRNPYIPFETPRATPKPPKRPERWNPNSIFPSRRVPPRKEKDRAKKYGRLDVSKFDKY